MHDIVKRLILLGVLILPIVTLASKEPTGDELQGLCVRTGPAESRADTSKYQSCTTFLYGFATGSRHFPREGRCSVGPEVTREQLRQAWLDFADENAEYLHFPAGVLVEDAFESAWFCRR